MTATIPPLTVADLAESTADEVEACLRADTRQVAQRSAELLLKGTPSQADLGQATQLLSEAVDRRLRRLAGSILSSSPSPPWDVWVERSGNEFLWLDQILIEELRAIGSQGAALAQEVEEGSRLAWQEFCQAPWEEPNGGALPAAKESVRKLFRLWLPSLRCALTLAAALWEDRVRNELDLVLPTLPAGHSELLIRVRTACAVREASPGEVELLDFSGNLVGAAVSHGVALRPEVVEALISGRGLSMAVHRVMRFVVQRAREQAILHRIDLTTAAPIIRVVGGMDALAEKVGAGRGHSADVELALEVLQCLRVSDGPRLVSGLLTWSLRPHAPGRRAEVTITPSEALVAPLPRGKLVPLPHRPPPFAGSVNEYAAQMSLQLLVIEEFRRRARQLAQEGAIDIEPARWRELAEAAGVRPALLKELLGGPWVIGKGQEPPLVARTPTGRWRLGDAYDAETRFLRASGKYELAQSARGKKSAALRKQ